LDKIILSAIYRSKQGRISFPTKKTLLAILTNCLSPVAESTLCLPKDPDLVKTSKKNKDETEQLFEFNQQNPIFN